MAKPSDLLPPNATAFEKAFIDGFCSYQIPLDSLHGYDINKEDAKFLAFRAWEESVEAWDTNWSEEQKRNIILSAPIIHKQKGTVASIKSILAAFGSGAVLKEWWQSSPKGAPHTFDITLYFSDAGGNPSADFLKNIIKLIDAAKPLRSHYNFTVAADCVGGVGMVGVLQVWDIIQIEATQT